MKKWQLDSIAGERVSEPRVLFSTPEARGVVLHLGAGERMGRHQVRERAIVQVVSGDAVIDCDGHETPSHQGTLVVFEPSESHSVRAITDVELLLILAPWPAQSHYAASEVELDQQRLPKNATQAPEPVSQE